MTLFGDSAHGGAGSGAFGGETTSPGGPGETLRLLAFGLGAEWYALETFRVRAVEPMAAITPVPRAPSWLLGVFNLRGAIVPVVDPAPLLGTRLQEGEDRGLLVVFQHEGVVAALRVDTVDEMYEVDTGSLEPPLPHTDPLHPGLLLGQVRVRDRLIGVIDGGALLSALMEGSVGQ